MFYLLFCFLWNLFILGGFRMVRALGLSKTKLNSRNIKYNKLGINSTKKKSQWKSCYKSWHFCSTSLLSQHLWTRSRSIHDIWACRKNLTSTAGVWCIYNHRKTSKQAIRSEVQKTGKGHWNNKCGSSQ